MFPERIAMRNGRWGDEPAGCLACKYHRWKVECYKYDGEWRRRIVGCYCYHNKERVHWWRRSRRGTIMYDELPCDYFEYHWKEIEWGTECPNKEALDDVGEHEPERCDGGVAF